MSPFQLKASLIQKVHLKWKSFQLFYAKGQGVIEKGSFCSRMVFRILAGNAHAANSEGRARCRLSSRKNKPPWQGQWRIGSSGWCCPGNGDGHCCCWGRRSIRHPLPGGLSRFRHGGQGSTARNDQNSKPKITAEGTSTGGRATRSIRQHRLHCAQAGPVCVANKAFFNGNGSKKSWLASKPRNSSGISVTFTGGRTE